MVWGKYLNLFQGRTIFKEKVMKNNEKEYGEKHYSDDEIVLFNKRTQHMFMIAGNITSGHELIDILHKYREKAIDGPIGYEEVDRQRKIANYLCMALNEFKDKS
jgi:hypothetical protein